MSKIEYYNPHPYRIVLTNEKGQRVVVHGYKRIVLDESFKIPPKTLKIIDKNAPDRLHKNASSKIKSLQKNKKLNSEQREQKKHNRVISIKESIKPKDVRSSTLNLKRLPKRVAILSSGSKKQLVGKTIANPIKASANFKLAISTNRVTISNNIAIGILSYNRLNCVKNLLSTIREHTDLNKVTVFVSDESTDIEVKNWLRGQDDIIFIDNDHRLGVSGNSNRLLKCLSRFKYCFLLNDDVEIKSKKWIDFYINAHKRTGIHHFCFRQYGLIGASASEGRLIDVNDIQLQVIDKKPHGAMLFYTNEAFEKVGYFDEGWGLYGMEHVDWSNRVGLSGIQDRGFYDVVGSNNYLTITKAQCSTTKENLSKLKLEYDTIKDDHNRIWINHSDKVVLPSISYIIPIRDIGRTKSVYTVINNIRAQKFPVIDIVLAEEDSKRRINLNGLHPINYIHVGSPDVHFNKSRAFNIGTLHAEYNKIILHDADILVQDGYTAKVFNLLDNHDAVHIGKDVMYFSKDYTDLVNSRGEVAIDGSCINQVGYFEGGSLACLKNTYYNIGGFNDAYVGYGIEDCDFFMRLKSNSKQFYNIRSEVFYHLFHGRTPGWQQCHENNKFLFGKFKSMPIDDYLAILRKKLKVAGFRNE